MSLEDAIKEVAAAIRYYADVQKANAEAMRAAMFDEDSEPAPVLSLAEKRKAEPLTQVQGLPLAEVEKQFADDAASYTNPKLSTTRAGAMTDLNVPAVVDAAEAQRMLDESLTDDYVIECFKKSIATQGKPKTAEIMKKYGATGKLLDSIGRVSITRDKWADLCREFLG